MANDSETAARKVADLHAAWVWDCNECGIENFVRSVVSGMTAEEDDAMRKTHSMSDDETGCHLTAPKIVECCECGMEYEAHVDLPECY